MLKAELDFLIDVYRYFGGTGIFDDFFSSSNASTYYRGGGRHTFSIQNTLAVSFLIPALRGLSKKTRFEDQPKGISRRVTVLQGLGTGAQLPPGADLLAHIQLKCNKVNYICASVTAL